ncbi:MAG: L-aspartate oxidase [Gemmatimonadota bacterium]
MQRKEEFEARVLVIGTGIAGLTYALKAAEHGPVLVVTKKRRADSSTNYAQGGIAAGLGEDDDPSLHLADTLAAGAGLCHPEVVDLVVREGPLRVGELVEWGVRFHRENGNFSLGMEGGHSRRRILRAGDRTGWEIERALLAAVAANPRIRVLQHLLVVDLEVEPDAEGRGRCVGATALDTRRATAVRLRAPVTMLAAGGCGQVYQHTTNPSIATGDGIAMAWRAGADVGNMEFIQFHPTALHPAEDPAFLLTEALRGEGAVLRRLDGTTFLENHHPRASLAPRDVVARAIHSELEATGDPHVILDVSPIPRALMEERFPGTVRGCRERGVELFESGIPVVPAAHYVCGGVMTDVHGRTSLPGLYAAGEVACTGVHGANRLASNSLLEAVVFSHRAAEAVADFPAENVKGGAASLRKEAAKGGGFQPSSGRSLATSSTPAPDRVARSREELRALMWERVGIVRTDGGLEEASLLLEGLSAEEERRWTEGEWTVGGVELRNLLEVGRLIVECARRRLESRGLHYNRDHPGHDGRFRADTVLRRERAGRGE